MLKDTQRARSASNPATVKVDRDLVREEANKRRGVASRDRDDYEAEQPYENLLIRLERDNVSTVLIQRLSSTICHLITVL